MLGTWRDLHCTGGNDCLVLSRQLKELMALNPMQLKPHNLMSQHLYETDREGYESMPPKQSIRVNSPRLRKSARGFRTPENGKRGVGPRKQYGTESPESETPADRAQRDGASFYIIRK